MIAPFSPLILNSSLPINLVNTCNDFIDNILVQRKESKERDWGNQLAGNIDQELLINDLLETEPEFHEFILIMARNYLKNAPNPMLGISHSSTEKEANFNIEVSDIWCNEMVAGDFNPVHFHSNCHLSCVCFLRLPDNYEMEYIQDKKNMKSVGCLQFIDGRSVTGGKNMYLVKPLVSEFYLFPSWLLHCVYPFKSKGVRRSISANIGVSNA